MINVKLGDMSLWYSGSLQHCDMYTVTSTELSTCWAKATKVSDQISIQNEAKSGAWTEERCDVCNEYVQEKCLKFLRRRATCSLKDPQDESKLYKT